MRDCSRKRAQLLSALIFCASLLCAWNISLAAGSWNGVDEAVVERIAKEHGREAKAPLWGPGGGDLLLFVSLGAGACGGFVAGYYWRELVGTKERQR